MKVGLIASAVTAAAVGLVALVLNHVSSTDSDATAASAVPAAATPANSTASSSGSSCPLSTAKQREAVDAWNKLMPVFRHPRCLNCHGGIPNPIVQPGEPPRRHMNVVDFDSTMLETSNQCANCHVSSWRHTKFEPLDFTKKTDTEICSFQKKIFNAEAFIGHISTDELIMLAFEGRRGLDSTTQGIDVYEGETDKKFVPEPPPVSHSQFIQMVGDWIGAQGGKFAGDEKCGCEVTEKGEVYRLTVLHNDFRYNPFVITDSVTMKIRIQDTTVTVYELKNFLPSAFPSQITSADGINTRKWVIDPIGNINVVTAVGKILLDYPEEGTRRLLVYFTHKDIREPRWELIFNPRNERGIVGGQEAQSPTAGPHIELLPEKTFYETVFPNNAGVVRLTLLSNNK